MIWVFVLFAVAVVAVVIGVHITRKQDNSGEVVRHQYDDPLLNDIFAQQNAQDKLDTIDQQHQNTDNFNASNVYDSHFNASNVYDSHGNLVFGHQDDTDDLDYDEWYDDDCADCGCDPCECEDDLA